MNSLRGGRRNMLGRYIEYVIHLWAECRNLYWKYVGSKCFKAVFEMVKLVFDCMTQQVFHNLVCMAPIKLKEPILND